VCGVLVCVGAALYAGLGLRVAVQSALDELDFGLGFVEFGICLRAVRRGRAGREAGVCTSASSTEAVRIRPGSVSVRVQ
jgi:hypothetical protein